MSGFYLSVLVSISQPYLHRLLSCPLDLVASGRRVDELSATDVLVLYMLPRIEMIFPKVVGGGGERFPIPIPLS